MRALTLPQSLKALVLLSGLVFVVPSFANGKDKSKNTTAPSASSNPMGTKLSIDLSTTESATVMPIIQFVGGDLAKALDQDFDADVVIPDVETVKTRAAAVAPDVYAKITGLFKGGEEGFLTFVGSISGQSFASAKMRGAMAGAAKSSGALTTASAGKIGLIGAELAPFMSLLSGAGVEVTLPGGISIINVDYPRGVDSDESLSKDDLATVVKHGRTFVLTEEGYVDPSDILFLKTTVQYFSSKEVDPIKFYTALTGMVTKMDASGIADLGPLGQKLLAFEIGIGFAEGRRFGDTKWETHSWHIDLLRAACLAPFIENTGKVAGKGTLIDAVKGSMNLFGVGQNGSGLGESRVMAKSMTHALSMALETHDADLYNELYTLLGKPKVVDFVQSYAEVTGNPKDTKIIESVDADALDAAMVKFLVTVFQNSSELETIISGDTKICAVLMGQPAKRAPAKKAAPKGKATDEAAATG